jgi:hypothetical protein
MKCTKFISISAAVFAVATLISCASTGGEGAKSAGPARVWAFDDPVAGTDGWELTHGEFYEYNGDIALTYDDVTFGNGMLKLELDFTEDAGAEWSEPKLKIDLPKSINMRGITQFAFDFYYNPSYRTAGSFKVKVFSNNGASVDSAGDIAEDGEDAGDGFIKSDAVVPITPTAGFLPDMRFSIVGSLTDYQGPVFLDNLRWE